MIRLIDIRLNAAHPELPLAEAVTYTGAPSTVLIRGVPGNCGKWGITSVYVAATFPDGSTSTRLAVQSANGVWVATLPATNTSGRTVQGLRIMADGVDENGELVTGYILGVADFAVASLGVAPAPEPGQTSWQMLYFDTVPSVLRKGDVVKIDGVLKFYNGSAWEPFAAPVTFDDTVTPNSGNGVKSSGIWAMIWGTLWNIPEGVSSVYAWVLNRLGLKRDLTDLAVYELAWTPGDPAGGGEGTKFTLSGPGFDNPLQFLWDATTTKWKAVGSVDVYISRTATGFHCDSISYVFAEGFDFSLGAEHTYNNIVDGARLYTITGYTRAPVAGSDTLAKVSQLAEKQDVLTFDSEPLSGSTAPVTSDGIFSALTSSTIVNRDMRNLKVAGLPASGTGYFVFRTYDNFDWARAEWDSSRSIWRIGIVDRGFLGLRTTANPEVYEAVHVDLRGTVTHIQDLDFAVSDTLSFTYNGVSYTVFGVTDDDLAKVSQLAGKLASTSAAPAWVGGTAYAANALVSYNGVVYQNTSDGTIQSATTPDTAGSGWTAKPVSDLFLPLTGGTMAGVLNFVNQNNYPGGGLLTLKSSNRSVSINIGLLNDGRIILYGGGGGYFLPELTLENLWRTLALAASNPTAGNLAALDANGNPTDSQIPKTDVALKPANPTANNLVKTTATGGLQDAGYHFEVRNGIPCIVQYT